MVDPQNGAARLRFALRSRKTNNWTHVWGEFTFVSSKKGLRQPPFAGRLSLHPPSFRPEKATRATRRFQRTNDPLASDGRMAEVFSGGQPHTALCVGDGVNICAYEPGAWPHFVSSFPPPSLGPRFVGVGVPFWSSWLCGGKNSRNLPGSTSIYTPHTLK